MGVHIVEGGALRAMAMQRQAVLIVAMCQYLVSLPCGYLFGI